MSVPVIKVFKSVILNPGEEFVLPPNARVIASSNATGITSTCDVGELQELGCYTLLFGNSALDGSSNQFFEASCSPIVGVSYNNIYKEFPTPFQATTSGGVIGQYNLAGLVTAINNASNGSLINAQIGEHNEGNAGIISFITFRAIPAVANSLQVKLITCAAPEFNPDENIEVWIKPRLTADLSNYSGLPACV